MSVVSRVPIKGILIHTTKYKGWTPVFAWLIASLILHILSWSCHMWTVFKMWHVSLITSRTVISVGSWVISDYFFAFFCCSALSFSMSWICSIYSHVHTQVVTASVWFLFTYCVLFVIRWHLALLYSKSKSTSALIIDYRIILWSRA